MDRYEKSLQTLELPAVLELLAGQASGEAAKAACRAIRPAEMEYDVRKRLGETSAAKAMMVLRGAPGFSGVRDVRGALARADMGGVLNTREHCRSPPPSSAPGRSGPTARGTRAAGASWGSTSTA